MLTANSSPCTAKPSPSTEPVADKGRQRRELLEWPAGTDPAADHWKSGRAWQVSMEQVPFKGPAPPAP